MAGNCVFRHPRPLLVTYLISRHQNFDLWENRKFWILKKIFFAKPTNPNPYLAHKYFYGRKFAQNMFQWVGAL